MSTWMEKRRWTAITKAVTRCSRINEHLDARGRHEHLDEHLDRRR